MSFEFVYMEYDKFSENKDACLCKTRLTVSRRDPNY